LILLCPLFGILLLSPSGAQPAELSFDAALNVLRERNEALKAARTERDISEQQRLAARGLYLPKIELGARYVKLNDPISIDLNPVREVLLALHPTVPSSAIPSFDLDVQDGRYWQAYIGLTWPVFTGGRITAANRASDALLDASNEELRATEYGLMTQLAQRYFGLRLAQKVVDVRFRMLEAIKSHLARAGALEKEGMIAKAERLHAEVAHAEADRLHRGAIRDACMAETALRSTLSMDSPVKVSSPLFTVENLEDVSYFKETAVKQNPLLHRLAAQKEAAHQGFQKEKGTLFPEVYLFANRQLHEDDLTVLDPSWAAGMGLTMTLFDGMKRTHKISAARLLEKKTSHIMERAQRDILTLIEKRYQEVMKAGEQLQAIAASFAAAEENIRVRTRAFEEGFGTSLDVVDAECALCRARLERLAAVYQLDVSLAGLLEASGRSERFDEYRTKAGAEVIF